MTPVIPPIWLYIAEICYNLNIVCMLGIFGCSLLILGLIVDRNIDNKKTSCCVNVTYSRSSIHT